VRRPRPWLALLALAGCAQRLVPHTPPVPALVSDHVASRVILIGDAGAPVTDEPVLQALGRDLALEPDRTLAVFLGDNIYPRGLPRPGTRTYAGAERRLFAQVDVVKASGARAVMIPGNHDWDRFGPDGWNAVRRQETAVLARGADQVTFWPREGCPGPVVLDEGRWIRVVIVDTEWFLRADRPDRKPMEPGVGCRAWTPGAVADSLAAALAGAGERRVVVVGHHPLVSGGEHGGFFPLTDHLFPLRQLDHRLWVPLPILGSVYPVARNLGISSQDIPSGRYRAFARRVGAVFRNHPPLLYAAGHEHNLQVIQGPYGLQLISGSGIRNHQSPVEGIPGTCLALSEPGYMRLDVTGEGRVRLAVITVGPTGMSREVWSAWLDPDRWKEAGTCGS
jgi:calcineurin-like phosphoesterase family protein